ncbi:MAG: hypothetical protein R6V17_05150 [Halanaerobacter sp.]
MKKLIFMTLALVMIFSFNAAAETNLEFDLGSIEVENISDDPVAAGKLEVTTDELNYKDSYDFIEFSSTFSLDDSDYDFFSSDLMLYSEITSPKLDGKYIGLGVKHLFIDDSQVSDSLMGDISTYAFPIAFKVEEEQGESKIFFTGSAFKGRYNIAIPGEDAESDFSGFSLELGVKFELKDSDMKLSYKQEDFSFDEDSSVGLASFDDDYKGLFLGIDF